MTRLHPTGNAMIRVTRLFAIFGVTIALALAGLSAAPTSAEAATKCTISKSEYKKIKKGQTRSKVKKITKCSGKRSAYEGQSQT